VSPSPADRQQDSPDRESLPSAVAASGSLEVISRFGYIVHGSIYIVIGALAVKLVWGSRGQLADPPSAIGVVSKLPVGDVLVGVIAVGLAAYALWRFIQAVADPDSQGRTVKGLVVRIGRVVSGIGYSALALFAAQLAAGTAADGQVQTNWAIRVLTEPIGALTGGLVALILIVVASDDVRKACTANFGERLKDREMGAPVSFASRCAGRWGFAARAVILVFGGAYLMRAVLTAEPYRAQGFEGILASLLGLPYGEWVLGVVALGLAAYGVFMVQAGLYRRHPF
jgi:hypothetical protein